MFHAVLRHAKSARGDRVTFMKARRSAPAWIVSPRKLVSRNGWRRRGARGTELAGIEGGGDHRAPARARTRKIAVDIGYRIAALEPQRRVRLEERDHARRRRQESIDACRIEVRTQQMLQVGPGMTRILHDPHAQRQRIARREDPIRPTRRSYPRSGCLSLGNDDTQAVVRRGHRSRQAAGARAHHQEVALDVFRGHRRALRSRRRRRVTSSFRRP